MSFFHWINLGIAAISSWCFCFAATNFGAKVGKLNAFINTSGFKYISDANQEIADKLYDEIVKVASRKDSKAPNWAKKREELKKHCQYYQYSLRHWAESSKYCLIQNNVRHKLVENKFNFKSGIPNNNCTEDLLNSFADSKDSLGFLIGKKECVDNKPN